MMLLLLIFTACVFNLCVANDLRLCDSAICDMRFDKEGLYESSEMNRIVTRIELDRFPNSILDTRNLPELQQITIRFNIGLPSDLCKIVILHTACIKINVDTPEKDANCCNTVTPTDEHSTSSMDTDVHDTTPKNPTSNVEHSTSSMDTDVHATTPKNPISNVEHSTSSMDTDVHVDTTPKNPTSSVDDVHDRTSSTDTIASFFSNIPFSTPNIDTSQKIKPESKLPEASDNNNDHLHPILSSVILTITIIFLNCVKEFICVITEEVIQKILYMQHIAIQAITHAYGILIRWAFPGNVIQRRYPTRNRRRPIRLKYY